MPRDEMIARMSSEELTAWSALFDVQAEEYEARQDATPGQTVYRFNREPEDDEDDDGGEAE